MLTERGWAVAGAGLALAVLWVLLGEIELGVAAVLLLAALVFGTITVLGARPRLDLTRRMNAGGVHEGDHASVTLRLTNQGKPLRHVTLRDEVVGLGTAEFATFALAPREPLTATYRVMCRPRGVYPIGPAVVRVADPLGLMSRTHTTGSMDTLVVYPAIENLSGLPGVPGRNLAVNARRPEHSQRGGEDFYTLRDYQQGDDLRRVHWPSSARRDRLMIRQLETPWQARALVMLDVRADAFPDDSAFEAAVSGAASVLRHLVHDGFAVDLWAGGSPASFEHTGPTYALAMEQLAVATTHREADLIATGTGLRNSDGGMLVLVTGSADADLLGLARLLANGYPSRVLMASSTTDSNAIAGFQREDITVVSPAAGEPWAPAWARTMRGTWHTASVGS